jgi:hypothetical protein
VRTALRVLDALEAELAQRYRELAGFARCQPGGKALQAQYGVGVIAGTAIWAFLGDTRRCCSSRQAVRHTGLDGSGYSLRRQTQSGPPVSPRTAGAALGTG